MKVALCSKWAKPKPTSPDTAYPHGYGLFHSHQNCSFTPGRRNPYIKVGVAVTFTKRDTFTIPWPLTVDMEATHGDYDITEVEAFDTLNSYIKEMYRSDNPAEILADLLLNGHEGVSGYLTFGNNKISKNTGIFNMNSATDCPNAESDKENPTKTGVCQVPFEDCYAHKAENIYPDALKKRRLQEYLWDCVNPEIFAEALLRVKERKRSPFKHLRVSESGDFRHNGDIRAWDRVAELVSDKINVYTYSASHKLSAWDTVEHFTINQSNNLADYGDRLFSAVTDPENIPDDAIFCPFEAAKNNGVETDNRPKCGECEKCIHPESEQERDVYITIH